MKRGRLQSLVFTALMTAVTVLVTVYGLHVPVGTGAGYVHLGDAVLYLTAASLPLPQALFAAAVGGGLSDLLSGTAIWVLPTVVIKSLMMLPFSSRGKRLLTRRNAVATVLAGAIGTVGYAVAGGLLYGSVAAGLADVIPSMVQEAVAAGLFCLMAAMMDRMGWKGRFFPPHR